MWDETGVSASYWVRIGLVEVRSGFEVWFAVSVVRILRNPVKSDEEGILILKKQSLENVMRGRFLFNTPLQRQARQKDFRKKGKNALLFMAHSRR